MWLAAGFNIFRLGVPDMVVHWTSHLIPPLYLGVFSSGPGVGFLWQFAAVRRGQIG